MITARPYQRQALDALYAWFYANPLGNPLLVLPTGSGKAVILALLVQEALTRWHGTRVLMLTHVRELIAQNTDKMRLLWPDAPMGIHSAGLRSRATFEPVIFAGIQSVHQKAWHLGRFDIIVIDEAHLINPKAQGIYRNFLHEARIINPAVRVVGLTATPWRTRSGSLCHGDEALFTDVAFEVSMLDLIAQGYLSPLISKRMVTQLDVSGVPIRQGEFAPGQLERAVNKDDITQAALDECVHYGENRRKWLVFCAGVNHAEQVAAAMQARGIPTGCVTGKTPAAERDALIDAYRNGRLRAMTNANVLCLDSKTEILTEAGWVGIDDMTMQHRVANFESDSGRIWFDYPKLVVRRQREPHERMVILETKFRSVRVTENHRMLFTTSRAGEFRIVQARDIVGLAGYLPIAGHSDPVSVYVPQPTALSKTQRSRRISAAAYNLRKNGTSPVDARTLSETRHERRQSLRYTHPDELTLAECQFIGFWLGDGSIGRKKNSGLACTFSQSRTYPRVIAWFDRVLSECGFDHSRGEYPDRLSCGTVVWTVPRGTGFGPQARHGFFALTPYLDKCGTDLFSGLSVPQFDALLEGFMLADGLHGDANSLNDCVLRVAGTQKQLYDRLQALAVVRGWSASISRLAPPINARHSQQYSISFRRNAMRHVMTKFRLSFEDAPHLAERVWCVTSTTGNIVTRRDGKVTIMGNTTGFDVPAIDLLVMLRPTQSPGLFCQMAGRGLRKSVDKENCLVLDFAGNTLRHGPVDQIKAWIPKPNQNGPQVAPTRTCPTCQTILATAIRVCPECGYSFPVDLNPPHAAQAVDAPILSTDLTPRLERHPVHGVHYQQWPGRHGNPPTLRVDYRGPYMRIASEWICLEHGGMARAKAASWWAQRAPGTRIPATIDEALARQASLRRPAAIHVNVAKKYPEITGYDWTTEPTSHE